MSQNNFGNALRKTRGQARLTQTQLAARMGVSAQTIGSWESGTTSPTVEEIYKLAEVLGKTPAVLFGEGPPAIGHSEATISMFEVAMELGKTRAVVEELAKRVEKLEKGRGEGSPFEV